MQKLKDPQKQSRQFSEYSRASLDKITADSSRKRERPVCASTMPIDTTPEPLYRGQVRRFTEG